MCPPKHNPTKLYCFLTRFPLNPEASRTNVLEETPYTWRQCQRACAQPATGVARARWDKDIPARPNPPLTRAPLGQSCAASWVSRSRPAATQPGLEPGSLVAQLALHHPATREAVAILLAVYPSYCLGTEVVQGPVGVRIIYII